MVKNFRDDTIGCCYFRYSNLEDYFCEQRNLENIQRQHAYRVLRL